MQQLLAEGLKLTDQCPICAAYDVNFLVGSHYQTFIKYTTIDNNDTSPNIQSNNESKPNVVSTDSHDEMMSKEVKEELEIFQNKQMSSTEDDEDVNPILYNRSRSDSKTQTNSPLRSGSFENLKMNQTPIPSNLSSYNVPHFNPDPSQDFDTSSARIIKGTTPLILTSPPSSFSDSNDWGNDTISTRPVPNTLAHDELTPFIRKIKELFEMIRHGDLPPYLRGLDGEIRIGYQDSLDYLVNDKIIYKYIRTWYDLDYATEFLDGVKPSPYEQRGLDYYLQLDHCVVKRNWFPVSKNQKSTGDLSFCKALKYLSDYASGRKHIYLPGDPKEIDVTMMKKPRKKIKRSSQSTSHDSMDPLNSSNDSMRSLSTPNASSEMNTSSNNPQFSSKLSLNYFYDRNVNSNNPEDGKVYERKPFSDLNEMDSMHIVNRMDSVESNIPSSLKVEQSSGMTSSSLLIRSYGTTKHISSLLEEKIQEHRRGYQGSSSGSNQNSSNSSSSSSRVKRPNKNQVAAGMGVGTSSGMKIDVKASTSSEKEAAENLLLLLDASNK